MRGTGAIISVLFCARLAHAQDAPTAEPPPGVAPEPASIAAPAAPSTIDVPAPPPEGNWSDMVTVSGLVEAYYGYKVGARSGEAISLRSFEGGAPPPIPAYDATGDAVAGTLPFGSPGWAGGSNSFVPSLAKLAVDAQGEQWGFRMDFGFGSTMALFNFAEGNIKFLQQAFGTYRLNDRVSLDFGKFNTSAGAEVLENNNNFTFSRSFLFTFGPFVHTGAKVNVKATDELTLTFGVVNGWDVDFDNNADKTFQFTALYALPTGGAISFTTYQGKEGIKPVGGELDWRMFYDLVFVQEFTESFKFNFNAAFGKEGDSKWFGAAASGRYAVSDALALALRLEHFNDPDNNRFVIGGLTDGSHVTSVTGAISLPFGSNAELRGEYRADVANEEIFTKKDSAEKVQMTAFLAALVWF